jgi:transposase-like protein
MADAKTWAKRVAGWRASGQTAAEYCKQHGLGLSALRHWSHRLRREEGGVAEVRMARVVVAPAEKTSATERAEGLSAARSALVLEVRGARITVEAGFDRATLAKVLELLGVEAAR